MKDMIPHQGLEGELSSGPVHRKRRLRPLRVVEVRTRMCVLSIVAAGTRWDAGESITMLNLDDLSTTGGTKLALTCLNFRPTSSFHAVAHRAEPASEQQRENIRLLRRRRKRTAGAPEFH